MVGLDGTVLAPTTPAGNGTIAAAWSPDSRNIAFINLADDSVPCSQNSLWRLSLADQATPKLLSANALSLSVDVRWHSHSLNYITYRFCNHLHIAIANPDGSDIRVLTSGTTDDTRPSLSPDGTHIAYIHGDDIHGDELWVMNTDGTGKRALWTSSPLTDVQPVWSPDNTEVAFVSNSGLAIAELNPGIDTPRIRGLGGGANITRLNWSSDGCSLAFTTYVSESSKAFTGYRALNCVGLQTGPTQLGFTDTLAASWSPDNKRLVFTGCTVKPESPNYSSCAIYTVASDMTDLKQLTPIQVASTGQTWINCFNNSYSPDGTWIAFNWCDQNGQPTVHLIHPDGTNPTIALPNIPIGEHATWSPDNQHIAAETIINRLAGRTISEIHSYNLTTHTTSTNINGASHNTQPNWGTG